MSLLQKIARYALSPTNIFSYGFLWLRRVGGTAWGTLCLRVKATLCGVQLGRGVTACGPVLLHRWPDSRIQLGDGCTLLSSPWRGTAAVIATPTRLATYGPHARITLGKGVECTGASICARSTSIDIGEHSMLAPNCILVDSDFHAPWPAERRHLDPGMERDNAVVLGKNVWLGMRCIVLKGVHIGDGAIVGAGSVVTEDIPAYCVAAGTPARVIGYAPDTPSPGTPTHER